MADNKKEIRNDCQLQVVYESGEKLSLFDKIRHLFLRILSALRRRTLSQATTSKMNLSSAPGIGIDDSNAFEIDSNLSVDNKRHISFKPGEIVQIKPFDEIAKTIDSEGRCKGLQFMPGMKKYCGQKVQILKIVRLIFDERIWKMVKTRNTYILEGITCDGRDVFDGEGCDRTCYFFWKDEWLRKISPND